MSVKKKILLMVLLFVTFGAASAFAAAPTSFATAIPTTLIPSGFWQMVGVVFTAVAAVWGVTKGIRLFKRA